MISTQKNREEKWLPVHGYEEFYAVSSSGLIRRIGKSNCLTQHADSDGYLYVTLCVKGKPTKKFVHRLVAYAFVFGAGESLQVNHIDGVKSNNAYSNLEWVTAKENIRHAFSTGLNRAGAHLTSGKKHMWFQGEVIATCIKSGKETVMQGAKDMRANGFTDSLVYRCVNGKLKHHKKHTFRRADADI
ncbi:NUMOD4 motif-containing HNH endonuclease [Yersinia enterocolitica]|uniref:HNH nuclease domain-containing protein n=1 Tax=Yersinia intermedia TaxID=631 RepID=A0A209A569_YERIN|nr:MULTISPECIES: NUMOD4 motif-containing HNH endonuclease [Yersinia]EKN4724152.1 NUMOD4 motif-containing HNH endonuclease [Yersinia enterocolitica]EKN4736271.1 NUMOD4 motif-containing HNH endonuclease [Yersinia enterocolitica]EKN6343657.1 hypothetical protein [Yersinia enterocolitica]OVZ87902.1 hypothetical protein CBW57_06515 [Yersinia intermedia]CQJ12940.1 NUMOD4 motif [Yersinia enterocolitica]